MDRQLVLEEFAKLASDPAQLKWENEWENRRRKALGSMPADPVAKARWVNKARAWEKKNPGAEHFVLPGTADTPKPGVVPPWRKTAGYMSQDRGGIGKVAMIAFHDELDKIASQPGRFGGGFREALERFREIVKKMPKKKSGKAEVDLGPFGAMLPRGPVPKAKRS